MFHLIRNFDCLRKISNACSATDQKDELLLTIRSLFVSKTCRKFVTNSSFRDETQRHLQFLCEKMLQSLLSSNLMIMRIAFSNLNIVIMKLT